jgi:1,5-anhydro-D-fructose reductase (1,5-anhydro-D-mannitol-forming)
MGKKVRYGIIGFGSFAERAIAPAIRASHNSDLVAIQKRSREAAKQKAAEYGVPLAFDSVEDLVRHKNVDAVFIVSANSRHCPETIAAANAGKHVLVEKPMALSVGEAKKMIDVCKKHRVKLMVGHMIRFSPLTLRIKEIIQSGSIGAVTFVKSEFVYDGRTSHRGWLKNMRIAGGGPLFDIGVHCLDTIRFVLDAEVISVVSQLEPKPTKAQTESTAIVSVRLSKGILASIYCSYATPIRRSMIEVFGTDGVLSATDFTLGDRTIPLNVTQGAAGSGGETRTETIDVPNLYIEEITHFSSCILKNKPPFIPGEVGLQNQEVLDLALKGGTTSNGNR